jgi:hypothetical protein
MSSVDDGVDRADVGLPDGATGFDIDDGCAIWVYETVGATRRRWPFNRPCMFFKEVEWSGTSPSKPNR